MSQLAKSREYSSIEELNLEMQRLVEAGPIPRSDPIDRPSKAQRLVYDAWNAPDEPGSVALAQKALQLDPECADAHLFLALHPEDAEGMLKHAFEAVKAGRRTLDKALDRAPDDGQLWGFLPARPYLRARVFLASSSGLSRPIPTSPNSCSRVLLRVTKWLRSTSTPPAARKKPRYAHSCSILPGAPTTRRWTGWPTRWSRPIHRTKSSSAGGAPMSSDLLSMLISDFREELQLIQAPAGSLSDSLPALP